MTENLNYNNNQTLAAAKVSELFLSPNSQQIGIALQIAPRLQSLVNLLKSLRHFNNPK
jgi:hypothetical protein